MRYPPARAERQARAPARGPVVRVAAPSAPSPRAPLLSLQRAAGNRAVTSVVDAGRAIVGAADSVYERNADAVAAAIVDRMARPTVVHAHSRDTVRHATAPVKTGAESGTPVAPALQEALDARRGAGRALAPGVRSSFEREFARDLGAVRLHDDAHAHDLSRALGARAFTYGNDVFFRRGELNTSSRRGVTLLAHELTHVVQGGGGIGRKVIHRAVQTNGGTWDTETYQPVDDGAEIVLQFAPNANVDAKKIGLIQRAKKVEKGVNYDVNARREYEQGSKTQQDAQKRKAQRSDGESHIDRDIRMNNPIYGAPDLADGDIGTTPAGKLDMSEKAKKAGTASNYQLGHRYKKGTLIKSWVERSAMLYDKPNMPGATSTVGADASKKSEMIFETTALALEGAQKGMYYGSVSWGFKITDKGGAVLEPLAVASPGDPTAKMQQVMRNWNAGEFKPGQANPQIPVPAAPADDGD